jgi:hypothetical protein
MIYNESMTVKFARMQRLLSHQPLIRTFTGPPLFPVLALGVPSLTEPMLLRARGDC